MKQINVYFDDNEFKRLLKLKKKHSWHDFIILILLNHCEEAIKKGDLKIE